MDPFAEIPRRRFLQTGLQAAAAAVLSPAFASAAPADFHFIVITDLHYRDHRCAGWFEKVAAQIRAAHPRPAFVILAGDLAEDGAADQLGAVWEIFRPLPMPVHTLIGNHDYTLDHRRAPFENLFGSRCNRRFDYRGYQFLLLDSTEGRSVFHTAIPQETLAWLDHETPALSTDKPTVVITHFPLGTNWLRPRNADALLYRLRAQSLQACLSGHWHGLTDRAESGTHLSTGRCCSWWRENHDGSPLKGYTLCQARNGEITREFVAVAQAG